MNDRRPPRADVRVVRGRSSFDIVIPAPTITELELIEQLWTLELIEGETYFGSRWPVMLISWSKEETG